MELITALKNIGFTQQESIIYITLCKHGELTGYEAAKLSGISRSNAYAALSSLVDKGSAYIIEGTSIKYIAVTKDELINNATRFFNENLSIIKESLDYNPITNDPYVTITNPNHVIDKIKNMIMKSNHRLYFSATNEIIHTFHHELVDAADRQIKIVILSPEEPDCHYDVHHPTYSHESLKLIVDTEEVITGTLNQALYSRNKTLVRLIREAIINEIELINRRTNKE